jgi:hypothetical protein
MALVHTTVSAAVTLADTAITVASATGFSAGYSIRINDEMMRVGGAYVSGTSIPVIRGQEGTQVKAHAVTTGVVCGAATDWATSGGPQTLLQYPMAGRARTVTSYGASGAITLPTAGTDVVAILNGTSVLAMTVAIPTKDMDGCLLWIAGDGAAAHTATFAGGLSGASTSYDVITVNATAPVLLGPFMAVNSLWLCAVAVPMAGTVTAVTATVA